MTWCGLWGWEPGIVSAKRMTPEQLGTASRSHAGSRRGAMRAIKQGWDFETAPMDEDDADTLANVLLGRWHYFPFETTGFYAAVPGGAGPEPGYTGHSIVSSSPAPLKGSGCLKLASGGASLMYYDLQLSAAAGYTISCWCDISGTGAGTWNHYVRRVHPDGTLTLLKNNATSAANTLRNLAVSSGVLQLTGKKPDATSSDTTVDVFFDELVVFPFAVSDSFITSALYAGGQATMAAFTGAPRITAAGDFIRETSVTVEGALGEQPYEQGRVDATGFEPNLRKLSFQLLEC